MKKESPLKAEVKDGQLIISIGVDRIGDDRERTEIAVTDPNVCALEMCRMMCRQDEDGSSLLGTLIDATLESMADEGWLGVEKK